MKRVFDPVSDRKGAEFFLEYLPQLQNAEGRGPTVGNIAESQLGSVIAGWLVGLESEFRPCLQQLRAWFEEANVKEEKFGESPCSSAATRNDAYGLCCWMLDGKSDPAPYSLAVKNWEAHFQTEGTRKRGTPEVRLRRPTLRDPYVRGIPFEAKDVLHGSLADYLGSCIQSEQFSRGLELYERVGGKSDISDTRIQTDVHLGYWICKHAESGEIPREACQTIGRRVLQANLQGVWLSHGQYMRAAKWLKIVATHANWQMSPLEVILQAYALMPDVVRPQFS